MFLHFSAKKVECAKHQWIHLVGDQPESPQAFEIFVVNARWRSTLVRVYISLTLQSSYKPSMHFTMTCTTTHNGGPPGVLTVGTCSLRQSTNCLWKGGEVRKTLVLVRSKSFSVALEAEGRRSLRGMPEVSSLGACLKACKAARAWALRGTRGEGLKGGLNALCNAV